MDAREGLARRLLKTGVHFALFEELTPVGLCNTLSDSSTKPRVLFEQARNRVLHQLFRASSDAGRDAGELCLVLGGEMHFQCLKPFPSAYPA